MATPPPPDEPLDVAALVKQRLTWRVDPAYDLWFSAFDESGRRVYLRLNPRFPDDPLYALLVAPGRLVGIEDLPDTWHREGEPEWPEDAAR